MYKVLRIINYFVSIVLIAILTVSAVILAVAGLQLNSMTFIYTAVLIASIAIIYLFYLMTWK